MNNPSPQQASAPSEAATSGNGVAIVSMPSLEERSNDAFGITPTDPAADSDSSPATDSTAGSAGATDELAAARAARRAKYEALQADEAARVDRQAQRVDNEGLRKRLEEAERRAEAAKGHVDPSTLDEASFFDLAAKLQVSPQKLGEWVRERMTNPELAAVQAASRVVDPKLTAMEQRLEAQQKVIDNFVNEQASQRQQAEERHYTEQFHAFTRENAPTSPYAARFLEVHGPEEYAKLAYGAAARVPEGAGPQAILDDVEENLAQLAQIYAPRGAAQQRPAPTLPNPAAAMAPTTVSNTLAQSRASVVNEDENWSQLPFEERSARLFR